MPDNKYTALKAKVASADSLLRDIDRYKGDGYKQSLAIQVAMAAALNAVAHALQIIAETSEPSTDDE